MIRLKILILLVLTIFIVILRNSTKSQKLLLTQDAHRSINSLGGHPELLKLSLRDSSITANDYKVLIEMISDLRTDAENVFNSNTRKKLKMLANERNTPHSKWQSNVSIFNSIYDSYNLCNARRIDKALVIKNINKISMDSISIELLYINKLKLNKNTFFREKQRILEPKEVELFNGEIINVNAKLINPITKDSLIVNYLLNE